MAAAAARAGQQPADWMVDKATPPCPSLGPSHQKVEPRLSEALLHQSEEVGHVTEQPSLASRLGRGLARLHTSSPQQSGPEVVARLQQHFLLLSQRLHSAEVERRALRLEAANQKQAAKGPQDSAHLVCFSRVCEELHAALSREERLQTLIKKQHTEKYTHRQCRQEVCRKDQALRILGKQLSAMQREKREMEDSLQLSHRRRGLVIQLLRTSESTFTQVRDTLVQSQCSLQPLPLPPEVIQGHVQLSGAESMLGGSEVTACQSLLSAVSETLLAAFSRIGWLEGHVTASL